MSNPDYRKMFEDLNPYYHEPKDLNSLATFMSGRSRLPGVPRVFFGRLMDLIGFSEAEPPKIPAGYTYLAQFIIHDISFDEHSDRHERNDHPWEIMCPQLIKELRNRREPNFDLETVYGYEVPTNEGEIPRAELMLNHPRQLPLLKLGQTLIEVGRGVSLSYPNDLPRGDSSVEARIVDQRNDENLLLAQTQVAFIKFHNAIAVELSKSEEYKDESGNYKKAELFEKARKLTIRYYQTIILTDLLPRIIQGSVLKDVREKVNTEELFYRPTVGDMYIPLEFSVAAFRFGHSMIRNEYNVNVKNPNTQLIDIMKLTGRGNMGSTSFNHRKKLPSIWIIDWNLFYNIDNSAFNSAFNFAEPINTEIVVNLLTLEPAVANNLDTRANVLSAIDLYRGRRFGLPMGQDIASKIPGATVLTAKQIREDLILPREFIDIGSDEARRIEAERIKEELSRAFSEKTPLWFYILAEAEIQSKEGATEDRGKLSAVGSRIVAETVLQILYHSEYSILREPEWGHGEDFLLKSDKTFDMPEMLKFIKKMNQDHFSMLYPSELYPNITNSFDEINPLGNG